MLLSTLRIFAFVVGAAFLFQPRAVGQGEEFPEVFEIGNAETGDRLEKLISDLEEVMEDHNVPSAGIAIISGDEEIWVGGLGLADIETKRPADADTLWRIGSVSKMFVSLSALKLQEEGLLSLDDRLIDHLPEIPFENPWADTHPITLAHLLEHTSGFDNLHFNEYVFSDPTIRLKDALVYNPNSRKSRWRPGDYSTYSNANPPLVAYVIEKLVNKPFEQYVEETFFEPIGMPNADFFYRRMWKIF